MPKRYITLSYIITTLNKFQYLKEVMVRLLNNIKCDEEIVVVDGASTDGTVEYLTDLYHQGKIHQFISESDKGESHGYNKGLLIARGELIKLLTDDDAFYYPAIQECKRFMLDHGNVDVMGGDISSMVIENVDNISIVTECQDRYNKWLYNREVGSFTGLSLMIRRSSLSLIGLLSTSTGYPDTDYTLRITSLNVNIGWCTAIIAIRIDNPRSNFRKFPNYRSIYETDRLLYFYSEDYRNKKNDSMEFLRTKISLLKIKLIASISVKQINPCVADSISDDISTRIKSVFINCDTWLSNYNNNNGCTFLYKQ